jgi:pilus assembly protein CpaB
VIVAFLLAAVLAGGITFLLYRRLNANNARRQMTKIVVAAAELPMGVAPAAKDVVLLDWPADVPLAGTFSKIEGVLGRPLVRSIGAKEPIFQRDLGVEGSGIGLAAKIPPGMRATAVRSNEIVGVAGFLYPGSHVDVLATYNVPNGGNVTQTVLQDVEVVTAGQTIEPDPQGKPQEVNVVTLLLNPVDSQKLQLAGTQGTIQFVLRNGTDAKNVEIHPTRLDQLLEIVKPPALPTRVVRRTTHPPQKPVYVLEVIEGTKRTIHTF